MERQQQQYHHQNEEEEDDDDEEEEEEEAGDWGLIDSMTHPSPPPHADLTLRLGEGPWKMREVLVDLELASSLADAGRMIRAGLVTVDGQRVSDEAPQLDAYLRMGAIGCRRTGAPAPGDSHLDLGGDRGKYHHQQHHGRQGVYVTVGVARLGQKTLFMRGGSRQGEETTGGYVWETLRWQGDRGKRVFLCSSSVVKKQQEQQKQKQQKE